MDEVTETHMTPEKGKNGIILFRISAENEAHLRVGSVLVRKPFVGRSQYLSYLKRNNTYEQLVQP